STPFEDLYVVLGDWTPDQGTATFLLFVNPMVAWLWFGAVIVVLGTVVTVWPHPQASRAPTPARKPEPREIPEPLAVEA
ncbi:MAG: hypothetical protein KGJ86_05060, partial [Chloroflexota bacterium]|nr:hypothetical protein [Chloroflexota bacterium]